MISSHMGMRVFLLVFTSLLFLISCNKKGDFNPLPRAYPKVEPPVGQKVFVDLDYCPLTFDMMSYGSISQDNKLFEENSDHPCWFDLEYKEYNSAIHCSYLPLASKEDFGKRVQDAFKLTGKHMKKASYIEEVSIETEHGISGILFLLEGPTATPAQFFLTDSVNHYFRGALYHDAQVNRDSTQPITDYLMEDLFLLIESLRWKEG